ncbi:DUF4296 domain-containing protein [Christiangramia sediminis]|uniref:DUF4296 domain-containing protein n=1 Tax=Christiangramia sediminis TaxID=2881336 RepID=A0A9X1RZ10_9FLAO|nr:DUF4296 domain-containing protein [Christiangramia sediminis]MCB7482329.1 DUF4296 domain-containing protein [Christiangramia sediminis]
MIVNHRNTLLLLLLIVSVSCQDLKRSEKPKDLIPKDKMIDVLTEISLLHAARNYNKQKLEATGINPDTYIYEKFDIDSLQFERSSDWYSEHYDEYEGIYDSVKNRVQFMKNKLDSLREIEVKIEDSIKQLKKDSIEALDSLKVNPKFRDSLKNDSNKRRDFEDLKRKRIDSLIEPPVSTREEVN